MDSGLAETQFLLDSMEYQVNQVYKQAQEELEEKVKKFYKDFNRLDTQMMKKLNDGKITKEEYDTWRRNKIFNGKVWEQRKDIITKDLYNAHDIAQSVIYGYMPEVYAVNHNFATYQIEQDARVDTSYTLYSHETVERLLDENPELIPYRKLNREKFDSWTKKNIQAVMLQGVLQGESIPHIAKRLARTVSEKDRKCAIRDARTMTTGAMNGGKFDALRRAKAMGIDCKVQWRATFDDRTRDSHRAMDRETIEIGDTFSNGLRFPVDLHEIEGGKSVSVQRFGIICRETYNCRCSIAGVYKGLEPRAVKLRSNKAVGIPYEEWKKGHKASNEWREAHGLLKHDRKGRVIIPKKPVPMRPKSSIKPIEPVKPVAPKKPIFHSKLMEKWLGTDYEDVKGIIEKSPVVSLFNKFSDALTGGYHKVTNGGVFKSSLKKIEWDYETHSGMHLFSTFAHECGHHFDNEIGRMDGYNFKEIDALNGVFGGVKPFKEVISSSDEFMSALREDMQALEPYVKDGSIKTMFKRGIDTEYYNSTSGVQDALDGFYGTQKKGILTWGHGDRYYDRKYNRFIKGFGYEKETKQAYQDLGMDASNQTKVKKLCRQYEASSEAFANINSACTCGGMELEAIKKYMPKTLEAYRQITERIK